MSVVDWSRAQFALTAMFHWLFVPLTLGLSLIVAIMETIYLRTRSERWLAILVQLQLVCRRHLRCTARN